ncbi:DUF2225 domain-containing protein [Mangrovimonas sp. TPBH4]|uniref:DUF2225 domain-containing protein n=1 Tax=Mangrovimonas sp. TPBH4 TaxID=1645914 RepID=UPI000AB13587|nr:DUF2225 domain-containing protein [Mangrovimonas sp. TPBH4]
MKTILTFIGTILLANSIYGHTCSTKEVKCPIDKEKVEFCVTMSMTTFGTLYDFQKQGAIGNHYEELINACPKCHYSGYVSDFDTTFSKERQEEIKGFLSQYDDMLIDDSKECLIAGELKEFLEETNDEISNCYLIGSYLLRLDSTSIDLRIDFQNKTKKYLIQALEQNEYEDSSTIATINYLIGEMCRRTKHFQDAVTYYEKAINDINKKDWVEEVAIKQKELAIEKDDNNEI